MSHLKEIVSYINSQILANSLADSRFTPNMNGIAIGVPTEGVTGTCLPLLINSGQEGQYLGIDDIYNIQVYHKNNGITWQAVQDTQYGDGNKYYKRTAQMSLLAFGFRKPLGLVPEELDMLLAAGIPANLPAALLQQYNLNQALITLTGSNFDQFNLYKREFQSNNLPVLPVTDIIMLEIKYKIDIILRKDCVNVLSC